MNLRTDHCIQRWNGLAGRLNDRDIAILHALLRHSSRADVAAEIGCSERHLRRLITELLESLGVPTTHAAVALAVQAGAVPDSDLPH